jgi:hypothetical protein
VWSKRPITAETNPMIIKLRIMLRLYKNISFLESGEVVEKAIFTIVPLIFPTTINISIAIIEYDIPAVSV